MNVHIYKKDINLIYLTKKQDIHLIHVPGKKYCRVTPCGLPC